MLSFTARRRLSYMMPSIIVETANGQYSSTIHSRMLQDRVVFVNGPIDDTVANAVTSQLLYLESQSAKKPISMYINSPGGVVSSGLAIYDTMQYIKSPVHTLCLGQAASMGSLLLTAGETGNRRCLPNATMMLHEPSGQAGGMASDIEIKAKEIMRLKKSLTEIYSKHSGIDKMKLKELLDRDSYLTGDEAKFSGLIDEVIRRE